MSETALKSSARSSLFKDRSLYSIFPGLCEVADVFEAKLNCGSPLSLVFQDLFCCFGVARRARFHPAYPSTGF